VVKCPIPGNAEEFFTKFLDLDPEADDNFRNLPGYSLSTDTAAVNIIEKIRSVVFTQTGHA